MISFQIPSQGVWGDMGTEGIYIRTDHGASRPLPPDAPVRFEGKLTTLSEVSGWNDFEIFENGQWRSAMRVDPPVVMRFLIEVEVESICDPKEVRDKIHAGLRGEREFRQVTIKPAEEKTR